jgi:hypothetical protein
VTDDYQVALLTEVTTWLEGVHNIGLSALLLRYPLGIGGGGLLKKANR